MLISVTTRVALQLCVSPLLSPEMNRGILDEVKMSEYFILGDAVVVVVVRTGAYGYKRQ